MSTLPSTGRASAVFHACSARSGGCSSGSSSGPGNSWGGPTAGLPLPASTSGLPTPAGR